MSNRSSMLNLSQEVLLLIFVQFYAAATIDFRNGVVLGLTGFYLYGRQDRRRHHAPDTLSWVPEQLIPPLLICKYLRPIAWEAFLNTTQFVIAGEQMTRRTPMRRHSWLDIKLAKDPTDLARRLHCDLEFANLLCEHWDSSKNLLPSLKELTVTEKTEIKLPFDNSCKSFSLRTRKRLTLSRQPLTLRSQSKRRLLRERHQAQRVPYLGRPSNL